MTETPQSEQKGTLLAIPGSTIPVVRTGESREFFTYEIGGKKYTVHAPYPHGWDLSVMRVLREAQWPYDDVRRMHALLQSPGYGTMFAREVPRPNAEHDQDVACCLAYDRYEIRSTLQGSPAHGRDPEDIEAARTELRHGRLLAGMVYESSYASYRVCHLGVSPRMEHYESHGTVLPHVLIDALRMRANLVGRGNDQIAVDGRGVDRRTAERAVKSYLKLS